MASSSRTQSLAIVATVLLAILGGLSGVISPARAEALDWSSPASAGLATQSLHLHDALLAVSCPSETLCVATDEQGNIFTSTNPTGGQRAWSGPTPVGSGRSIRAVSCPSTRLCVAVDGYGDALTSTEPAGGTGAWHLTRIDSNIVGSERDLGGEIACPTTNLCVATVGGKIITSTDPTGGEGRWKAEPGAGPGLNYSALTCASETLCVVDGTIAEDISILFSTSNPAGGEATWKATGTDPSVFGGVGAMSCPTSTLCVGGDYSSNTVTSTEPAKGSWAASAFLAGGGASSMSCPTTRLCVGATNNGKIIASQEPGGGASKWKALEVDGYRAFTGLSCAPGTTLCVAVDDSGDILATKRPLAGADSWKVSRAGATVSLATELLSGTLGGRGAMSVTVSVNGGEYAGGPAPIKKLVLRLPQGTVLDTAGHPTCTAEILEQYGPRACPAGSAASPEGAKAGVAHAEASFGGVRVEEVSALEVFYSPGGGVLFYFNGQTPLTLDFVGEASVAGNVITLRLPEVETVSGATMVSIEDLRFQLGETLEEELAFISLSPVKLPPTCAAGHLDLAAAATLAAVPGLEELTLHGAAEMKCPPAKETPVERKLAESSAAELRLHYEEGMLTTTGESTTTGETTTTTGGDEEKERAAAAKRAAEEAAAKRLSEEAALKKATEEANTKRKQAEAAIAAALKQSEEALEAKTLALLERQLVPSGKSSKISSLRKHGVYAFKFTAPSAGLLSIAWYQVPKGSHLAVKAKPIPVATGNASFPRATTLRVTMRLTAAGKLLLRRSSHVKITARGTFTATGGRPVRTLRTFKLSR